MTIIQFLKKYSNQDAELLLAHVLRKSKEWVLMSPKYKLTDSQAKKISTMIKRRMAGEPLAYILGYKDFYGLRFKVNKDVLIPRPETEWVIDRVKALEVRGKKKVSILDIGTGSGCIAISIAKQIKDSRLQITVTASDISPAALKVAKQNAKAHNAKIKFIQSDLFANITGKFDVIIGNLPYVPLKMLHRFLHHKTKLKADDPFAGLKYEPSFALTDGTSSWQIYRRFFEQVKNHIHENSIIILETDPGSKKFLIEYQKKYLLTGQAGLPNWKMKFYKDYRGLLRFAEISKDQTK